MVDKVCDCGICGAPIYKRRRVLCDLHSTEEKEEWHKRKYIRKSKEAVNFIRSISDEDLLDLVGYDDIVPSKYKINGSIAPREEESTFTKISERIEKRRGTNWHHKIGPMNRDWHYNRHSGKFKLIDYGIEVPRIIWELFRDGFQIDEYDISEDVECYKMIKDLEVINVEV